jgi:CheY-like chemotaxis protein
VRILLVEDQPDSRRLLAALLRRAGYQVAVAEDVATALRQMDSSFNLLISDMNLPDGTGSDLLRRAGDRRPKAICLSGAEAPDDQHDGFARHLLKPVSFTQLQQTISEVLKAA